MAFVVEEIQAGDQEKILEDVAGDSRKSKLLVRAKATGVFPRKWAIDREKNCYLFLAPLLSREEAVNRPYFAFIEKRIYQINLSGSFSHKAYFVGEVPDSLGQDLIKDAFLVHGPWGSGLEPNQEKPVLSFITGACE